MKKINPTKILVLFIFLSLAPFVIEMFIYKGVFARYLRLQPNLIVLFFLALGIAWIAIKKPKVVKLKNATLTFIAFSFLIYILLGTVEYAKYPNFVFSTYHLHYSVLVSITAVFFAWFMLLVLTDLKSTKKNILLNSISAFLLSYYCFVNFSSSLSLIDRNFSYALANPVTDYNQKMEKYWGGVYSFIAFVKQETPEDSSIVLPDINAGGFTGNPGMVRYFLYPRKLVSFESNNIPNADFLIATPGNELGEGNYKFWPEVNIETEWVKYFDVEKKLVAQVSDNYDPNVLGNNGYYALLKLK